MTICSISSCCCSYRRAYLHRPFCCQIPHLMPHLFLLLLLLHQVFWQSVPFCALNPLQVHVVITATLSFLSGSLLWQFNTNGLIIDEPWHPLKPTAAAVLSALEAQCRKHFTHLPSGTRTAVSLQLISNAFAITSTQWYIIGFQG